MSENSRLPNYYDDLGLTPAATAAQIRAAYLRLAKLHHPDKKSAHSDDDASEFRKVQEAYEKLYDTKSREQYDEEVRKKTTSADTRPFNVFNPRPRARPTSPVDIPPRTNNSTGPRPSPKYHFHGTEFDEEPIFTRTYSSENRREFPPAYSYSPPPGVPAAHGIRVYVTDHPAVDGNCNVSPKEWKVQFVIDRCIFCLESKRGTSRCSACEAVACSRCFARVK